MIHTWVVRECPRKVHGGGGESLEKIYIFLRGGFSWQWAACGLREEGMNGDTGNGNGGGGAVEALPGDWLRGLGITLGALVVFMVVTQVAWEGWYPLSSFPMYSNPQPWEDYLYLTDAQDKPLPLQHHLGLSASKLNKMYRKYLKDFCVVEKAHDDYPGRALQQKAVAALMEKVRPMAERRGRPLPETVKVVEVVIGRKPPEKGKSAPAGVALAGPLEEVPTVIGEDTNKKGAAK